MLQVLVVGIDGIGVQSALAAVAMIEANAGLSSGPTPAIDSIKRQSPDLLAIDMSLESSTELNFKHLLDICAARTPPLPVLALLPENSSNAYSLALGSHDFVVPPFTVDEVAARMQRLLSTSLNNGNGSSLRFGDLVLDLARYEVTQDNKRMELTFKEYELLKFLATNSGQVFSREALLNQVWGYDYFGGTRTVDVHIRRLRSKIETGDISFIDTVRNVGYRFAKNEESKPHINPTLESRNTDVT